jgi:sugar transferase EpsL
MTKRIFDLLISLLFLTLAAPIILLLWVVLTIYTKGHPIFTQIRIGRYNRAFRFYKFKTMMDSNSSEWKPEQDDQRITCLGRYLRRLSLDEIPQFWNIIKGDMSLVGPRPLPDEYLPLYSVHQLRRHEVKPGLTGWAQINGRNSISWEERFKLDIWYIENASFKLDVMILFKTAINLLDNKSINKSKNLTMDKFSSGTKN